VTVFWALFDQQGSSWTLQAKQMDLNFLGMELDPSQIQALNPIMVMGLIPLFSGVLYPMVERMGIRVTPLRKMAVGMLLCAAAFAMVGLIQVALDSGQKLSVGWQILPYLVITISEVMVSITGLEFAYTQAPRSMKSTIMSFWLLTVAFGNLLAAVVSQLNVFTGSGEFFFFTGLMVVISGVFIAAAMGYRVRDFVESSDEGEVLATATQAS
jgi:POT family proton-dependent oligopeptide transporter